MALPPLPPPGPETPQASFPQPESGAGLLERLSSWQLIGRSLGIVGLSLAGAFLAWIIPFLLVLLLLNDSGEGGGLAVLFLGITLLFLTGTAGYVFTCWRCVRRWIPSSQRTISWAIVLGFVVICFVGLGALGSFA